MLKWLDHRIVHPEKVSFKNGGEMKTLSKKNWKWELWPPTNKSMKVFLNKTFNSQENIIIILNSYLIKYPQNMCRKQFLMYRKKWGKHNIKVGNFKTLLTVIDRSDTISKNREVLNF